MEEIRNVVIRDQTFEEIRPDFPADFPYRYSRVMMNEMPAQTVSWHWHPAFELIYIRSGRLRYETPGASVLLEEGDGAFVNSQVLHQSHAADPEHPTIVLCHLFDPLLLAGSGGSRMEKQYILPVIHNRGFEMLPVFGREEKNRELLKQLQSSFRHDPKTFGYELITRNELSYLWLSILPRIDLSEKRTGSAGNEEAIKTMLGVIQSRYAENLQVRDLARSAAISERECYRLFREMLHTSPAACLRKVRLARAAELLTYTEKSITSIAYACGLGSLSSFGRLFQEAYGCSPGEFRKRQKMEKNRQNLQSSGWPNLIN